MVNSTELHYQWFTAQEDDTCLWELEDYQALLIVRNPCEQYVRDMMFHDLSIMIIERQRSGEKWSFDRGRNQIGCYVGYLGDHLKSDTKSWYKRVLKASYVKILGKVTQAEKGSGQRLDRSKEMKGECKPSLLIPSRGVEGRRLGKPLGVCSICIFKVLRGTLWELQPEE